MERYKKTSTLTSKGAYLKKRIARTRSRAQFIGIVYLLSAIALAGAICLPMFVEKFDLFGGFGYGIFEFWKAFTWAQLKTVKSVEVLIPYVVKGLYVLMALGAVINVLRALTKLGWLFKKRASKTYGFNRNVYAMEDLGKIFSGTYSALLCTVFLMCVIIGVTVKDLWEISKLLDYLPLYIYGGALGGGIVLHFFCGIIGGKAGYFDLENGEIVEQKRLVGRFAPFLRNLLQLCAVFAMIYFFLDMNALYSIIVPLTKKGAWGAYIKNDIEAYITLILQILTVICLLPLIKHSTAITEYNINGANGSGMKTFRVFSFFVFLTAGATVACRYVFGEAVFFGGEFLGVHKEFWCKPSIYIASIAFVMFVIELIMHNMPKIPVAHEEPDYAVVPPMPNNQPYPYAYPQAYANPNSPYANAPVVSIDDYNDEVDEEELYRNSN